MITDCVKHFIEQYYIKRFLCVNMDPDHWRVPDPNPHTAGYKDVIVGETFFYFFPRVFKNEVCAGQDYKEVLKVLMAEGLLKHDDGMFTFTADLTEWRRRQTIVAVSAKILDPWFPHVYYKHIKTRVE